MSLNGASRVILVVEDEWLVRDMVVQALRDAGWHVIEASTAEDAIALTRTGHHYIDVVFTDIQLAGRLCGWDVAEQCRAARADFPVIYASGNAADRSRKVAGSLFFNKPYSTAVVRQAHHWVACKAGHPLHLVLSCVEGRATLSTPWLDRLTTGVECKAGHPLRPRPELVEGRPRTSPWFDKLTTGVGVLRLQPAAETARIYRRRVWKRTNIRLQHIAG